MSCCLVLTEGGHLRTYQSSIVPANTSTITNVHMLLYLSLTFNNWFVCVVSGCFYYDILHLCSTMWILMKQRGVFNILVGVFCVE